MMVRAACFLSILFLARLAAADEADAVFSGPQPGEAIQAFALNGVRGDQAGKAINLVEKSADGPLLIVFFHEKTRPAFGLTNAVVRFAETRAAQGLTAGVVFLTADATETEKWLKSINQMLPSHAILGISPDGLEGPGPWGLNRNVAMTVIVANKGKVTSNFALRQPSIEVDGPKIFQAIADVTGGGRIPEVSDFLGRQRLAGTGPGMTADEKAKSDENEAKYGRLLRPVINRDASEEMVNAAAARVEEEAGRDPAFRKRVAEATARIIAADKLANYGTPKAQEFFTKWAKEFASPPAVP